MCVCVVYAYMQCGKNYDGFFAPFNSTIQQDFNGQESTVIRISGNNFSSLSNSITHILWNGKENTCAPSHMRALSHFPRARILVFPVSLSLSPSFLQSIDKQVWKREMLRFWWRSRHRYRSNIRYDEKSYAEIQMWVFVAHIYVFVLYKIKNTCTVHIYGCFGVDCLHVVIHKTQAYICRRMLTYADLGWHMLQLGKRYRAPVCWSAGSKQV